MPEAIPPHDPAQDSTSLPNKRGKSNWLRLIPWLLILISLTTTVGMHLNGDELDPAIVNVATGSSVLLIWTCLSLALLVVPLPVFPRRSTRIAGLWICFLPVAAVVVFLVLYRVERIDGELQPVFRSRWERETVLPDIASEKAEIAAEKLEQRATDFPQFLGPTRDGKVVGVDLSSDWSTPPEVVWRTPVGDGWSGFAVQGDVAVTMEQRGNEEWVSCYDIGNGDLLWKYTIPGKHTNVMGGTGPRSTPTIFDNRVYAVSAVSRLVCVSLASGDAVWEQELLELAGTEQAAFELEVAWGRSCSPLIHDGQVIVCLGGTGETANTLIAFDAASGSEAWRAGSNQISYSSPTLLTLGGKSQVAVIDEDSLTAFDAETTSQLWSVPWEGSSSGNASVSQPVQVDEQHVLMSKGYGAGCQLIQVSESDGSWTAETVWKKPGSLRTKFTTAILLDGYAYGLSDGILECIDIETGERMWKKGRYQQGQVLLVGDKLLITSEVGEIVLVAASPERFEELGKLDVIGDVTWNTAALSGDRLLIRNSDEAACVRLPLK